MKRSKGFILAEILTGLLLQAGFILVLCGAFYLLVSFGSGTQQILTARERGQRVISYVDSRIRNAGLGMWRLKSSSSYWTALAPLVSTGSAKPLELNGNTDNQLRLPVAITDYEIPIENDLSKFNGNMKKASVLSRDKYENDDDNKNKIMYGNILTLIYAQKEEPTSQRKLFIVNNSVSTSSDINPDIYTTHYQFMAGDNKFDESDFNTTTSYKREQYIGSYAAMIGAGEPLYIGNVNDSNIALEPQISTPTSADPIIISGDELLYLKCERLFVYIDKDNERNFKFQKLTNNWGEREPHQKDILEIYMELDTETNIFTLYVLASGGTDGRTHECPKAWPTSKNTENKSQARWKDDYKYHVLYVSKASWKLHNIPDGFTWN